MNTPTPGQEAEPLDLFLHFLMFCLIAVGGIDSGAEAYRRIRAGASAVQIYSALIYEGPGLVGRIKRDLATRLRADGFSSVHEASANRTLTER